MFRLMLLFDTAALRQVDRYGATKTSFTNFQLVLKQDRSYVSTFPNDPFDSSTNVFPDVH